MIGFLFGSTWGSVIQLKQRVVLLVLITYYSSSRAILEYYATVSD